MVSIIDDVCCVKEDVNNKELIYYGLSFTATFESSADEVDDDNPDEIIEELIVLDRDATVSFNNNNKGYLYSTLSSYSKALYSIVIHDSNLFQSSQFQFQNSSIPKRAYNFCCHFR